MTHSLLYFISVYVEELQRRIIKHIRMETSKMKINANDADMFFIDFSHQMCRTK